MDNSADNGRFYLYAEYVHRGDRSRRQIEETVIVYHDPFEETHLLHTIASLFSCYILKDNDIIMFK